LKILLDECVDRRFRRALPEHEVLTVQEMGWSGMKNGELLHSAQAAFQVFITVDRNLYFQQNLRASSLAVFILCAKSNRLVDLMALAEPLMEAIESSQLGKVTEIGGN
jgi:predicted nuclease of predicted toxin-antitoxin system